MSAGTGSYSGGNHGHDAEPGASGASSYFTPIESRAHPDGADGGGASRDIHRLRGRGYRFVTVPELLRDPPRSKAGPRAATASARIGVSDQSFPSGIVTR